MAELVELGNKEVLKIHHLDLFSRFVSHEMMGYRIGRTKYAIGVRKVVLSTESIDGKRVGTCLMMRLLVVCGSLRNFLDSRRKQRGQMGGQLLVSFLPLRYNRGSLPVNLREGAGCHKLGVNPSSI